MSVNNSILEQHTEYVEDLPDMYTRELLRQKSSSATQHQIFLSDENEMRDTRGGYKDWKIKQGLNSSERMVSSLGRALHNKGIVPHDDEGNFNRAAHDVQPAPSKDSVDQHYLRHISSQSHQYSHEYNNGMETFDDCRQSNINNSRPMNGQPEGRQNHYLNNSNARQRMPENQFDSRCSDQCCSNYGVRSPTISPRSLQRDLANRNQSAKNCNPFPNEPPFINLNQDHNLNHGFNESPHRLYDACQPLPQCQAFRTYHPPQNCQCCHNTKEVRKRSESPKKNSTKKTDASIKKLYRILWLQNEQLGLLEKQVSKLIEVNFQKQASGKPIEQADKSESTETAFLKKVESNEIGIMTDLPCPRCLSVESRDTSSDSESEDMKKSLREDSLALNEVDIPVNRGEASSPPVSMQIDLHEYQETSSSETEESDTSDDGTESVGWTFYDNVVGQVNNMLKSAGSKKKKKKKSGYKEDIQLAMQQLKRLGLDQESNNAKRVTFEEGLREQQVNLRAQSEISMNFNALASKYLTSAGGKVQDISMCNVISSNTNMSLATLRYLERHHITNRDSPDALPKKISSGKSKKNRSSGDKTLTNKFLDITAIKQQPKLLPKNI